MQTVANNGARHQITLLDRSSLAIDGVNNVGSFDEELITLETNMGVLTIKGDGLHITQLNLDENRLVVRGHISALNYLEDAGVKGIKNRGKGILDRLLR